MLFPSAICPITQEVFHDPVVAADGHTYERLALQRWLSLSAISPTTGERLPSKELLTNFALRSLIDELRQCNGRGASPPPRLDAPSKSALVSAAYMPDRAKWREVLCRGGLVLLLLCLARTPDLEAVYITASQGRDGRGDLGAAAVLGLGLALCAAGVGLHRDSLAVSAVMAGVPLSALSFCCGMVFALGDSHSALLLFSRLLLVVAVALYMISLSGAWSR